MRYIIIIILFTLCHSSCEKDILYNENKKDTIYVYTDTSNIDSLIYEINIINDSINKLNDSINNELFVTRYKLERISYYCDIVDKRPSNIKFLKGWIRRVLNE